MKKAVPCTWDMVRKERWKEVKEVAILQKGGKKGDRRGSKDCSCCRFVAGDDRDWRVLQICSNSKGRRVDVRSIEKKIAKLRSRKLDIRVYFTDWFRIFT